MSENRLIFRVAGYTGMDYVRSLVLSERAMAVRVARAAFPGAPRVTVVMPSRRSFLVEDGKRATDTSSPALPF